MPLVLNQTIQIGGTGPATSLGITYASTPAAGNLLLTGISIRGSMGTITFPSGWTEIETLSNPGNNVTGVWAYKESEGNEGLVNWAWTVSGNGRSFLAEFDAGFTLDQIASQTTTPKTTSRSSGTTATQNASDNSAIGFWASHDANKTSSGQSFTNSYVQFVVGGGGGLANVDAAILDLSGTAAAESTFAWTGGSNDVVGFISTWTPAAGGGGGPESQILRRRFQGTRPRYENLLEH